MFKEGSTTDRDFDGSESLDTRDEAPTTADLDAADSEPSGSLHGATATYSPEDNKLRLYVVARLDAELYKRVRKEGFIWAPKQDLFVAPMWTPGRADLLIELCGDIGDEDTSLVDRAEERADRFEEYSEKRADDADAAHAAVQRITDGIPMGQPILVGHHSEKHARKDAERIENGMRKAVKMWETSKYWVQRAKGALRHAKYKERPDVRARRIKGLEADKRKQDKIIGESEKYLRAWSTEGLTLKQATMLANYGSIQLPPTPEHPYGHSVWSALDGGRMTAEEAAALAKPRYQANIDYHRKWLNHVELRLAYERAMLGEAGGTIADKTGPEAGGACRCWASPRGGWSYIRKLNKVSVSVEDNWDNGGPNFKRTIPFDKLLGVMTRAQVEEARAAGRIVEARNGIGFHLREVGDSESQPETRKEMHERQHREAVAAAAEEKARDEKFKALKQQVKTGVQVVAAPQLFPTPQDLAARMVLIADIGAHHRVLEPSAGTGAILREIVKAIERQTTATVLAMEINPQLAKSLEKTFAPWGVTVIERDFLTFAAYGSADRIVMNPPFTSGQDVEHVTHAFNMLAASGRLVAVMSAGVRFRQDKKTAAFRALVEEHGEMEDLADDTFKDQGTSVRTVLVTLRK